MNIIKDPIVQYAFNQEDIKKLESLLQDPLLRAYIYSSFAQLRESMLTTVQDPLSSYGVHAEERSDLALAFIGGAEELLTQITRIGDQT